MSDSGNGMGGVGGLTLGVGAVALLALIGMVYFAITARSLQEDLQAAELERETVAEAMVALEAASGELTDIEARLTDADGALAEIEARRGESQTAFETELAEMAATRDAASGDFEAQLATLAAQLDTARADFETELAVLTERRDAALAETETSEGEMAEVVAMLEAERGELDALRTEAQTLREQRDADELRIAEIDQGIVTQSAELDTVGARLEEARSQEATLRDALAQLQTEAAEISDELADAETRTQEVREAEAALEARLVEVEEAVAALEERRTTLDAEVADLSERRDVLQSDVADADAQRGDIQIELTEMTALLSSRTDELAEIEQRIADAITDGGSGSETADAAALPVDEAEAPATEPADTVATEAAEVDTQTEETALGEVDAAQTDEELISVGTFAAGAYGTGDVAARFAEDGSFEMTNETSGESARGSWAVEGGVLTLSDVEGGLRAGVAFPLDCALTVLEDGFALADPEGGGCGPLADAVFEAR